MATYYTNSNNQRDIVPTIYMPDSYPEPSVLPMYTNSASGVQMSCTTDLCRYEVLSGIEETVSSTRYLKTTQELLDEVVNVQNALMQLDSEKKQHVHDKPIKNFEDEDGRSKNSLSIQEHADNNMRNELSNAEKQDLTNKLTKLLSMLDKVDRRYKQYNHQMQIIVASFDAIAGCGAAKPYTTLALQTISRHFRCLRDTLSSQISATRKSLGEQDSSDSKSVGITRLRYIDQQLRQQRAFQTFGMMQQHAWRPQRGLPESSVSILRAWLFEHFLHPYPKDSDKIMLARQTGLTRGQVSNWFINARVRLWKPMVEEMYKEEFANVEMDSNSNSTETMTNALNDNVGQTVGTTYQNSMRQETETETEIPRHCIDESDMFLDTMVSTDISRDRFMASAYHMSETRPFEGGNGISLTLGLQYYNETNHSFDEIYNVASSSMGTDGPNFECLNLGNGFTSGYYTTLSLEK